MQQHLDGTQQRLEINPFLDISHVYQPKQGCGYVQTVRKWLENGELFVKFVSLGCGQHNGQEGCFGVHVISNKYSFLYANSLQTMTIRPTTLRFLLMAALRAKMCFHRLLSWLCELSLESVTFDFACIKTTYSVASIVRQSPTHSPKPHHILRSRVRPRTA